MLLAEVLHTSVIVQQLHSNNVIFSIVIKIINGLLILFNSKVNAKF